MKSGRRGRRGGRRQRRREAEAKEQARAQTQGKAPETTTPVPATDPANGAAPAASLAVPAHPRPMSARELVARLEARPLQGLHPAGTEAAHEHGVEAGREAAQGVKDATPAGEENASAPGIREPVAPSAPRRFTVAGQEWIARLAGRGTGGTGRVAQARLEAIRFSTGAEPERVAAEVLIPGPNLDALYDDELAELLERGLRSRKENG